VFPCPAHAMRCGRKIPLKSIATQGSAFTANK
jgi:hypothetical protein